MTGRFKARNQVAIVGFGQSGVFRHADVPLGSLAIEAADKAIGDAGLTRARIDGLSTFPLLPASTAHPNVDGQDIVTTGYIAQHLGIRPRWYNNYQGGGQIGSSVIMAVNAIATGAADYVLVHRALHNPPGRYHAFKSNLAPGPRQWTAPYGHSGPAMVALPYQQYMQRYGATREEMATLVVNSRRNVANNPLAYWYQKPIERDDYLNARWVAEPMSVLDCDIPVDGAAAFVLTSAERARDLPHKPVYIAGYVQSQGFRPSEFMTLDRIMEAGQYAGQELWKNTGLGPSDIDCPQIYDGFSPLTYWWLECLGFCPVGEAHRFVQDGRIDVKGKFPLLSGGGNLGNGRIHGIPHIRECYLQLAGRAGDRQLAQATVGISSHSFPHWGSALVYTAERL